MQSEAHVLDGDIILKGTTTQQVNQVYGRTPSSAFVQASRTYRRYAEVRLETLPTNPVYFPPVHQDVLLAERVALNPRLYHGHIPGVRRTRGRPLARPITDRHERETWIAGKLGLTPDLVREILAQASAIMALIVKTE